MPVARVDWNAKNLETVRLLYIEGKSYGEIAALFDGATRNAIAGLVNRKKWVRGADQRKTERRAIEARTRAKAQKPKPIKVARSTCQGRPRNPPMTGRNATFCLGDNGPVSDVPLPPQLISQEGIFLPAFAPEGAPLVSLVELVKHHCKWPIDTPDGTRFCGCNRDETSTYCAFHHKRARRNNGEAAA